MIIRAAKLRVSPAWSKKPTFSRNYIFRGNFPFWPITRRNYTFWPFTRPNVEVANFITSSILHTNGFAETSFKTDRFEYSPDFTSLASSKSTSVAKTKTLWAFYLPWLWRLQYYGTAHPPRRQISNRLHRTVRPQQTFCRINLGSFATSGFYFTFFNIF